MVFVVHGGGGGAVSTFDAGFVDADTGVDFPSLSLVSSFFFLNGGLFVTDGLD